MLRARAATVFTLTLTLLVTNLTNCYKMTQKNWKMTETLSNGYSSESTEARAFQWIPTFMTEFRWFSNIFLRHCALGESSLSIGRVNLSMPWISNEIIFCIQWLFSKIENCIIFQVIWRRVAVFWPTFNLQRFSFMLLFCVIFLFLYFVASGINGLRGHAVS